MEKIVLGKVGVTNEGAYTQTKAYPALGIVSHKGQAYLSFRPSLDVEPGTDDTVWMLIADRGESLYQMMVREGRFEGTEADFLNEYEEILRVAREVTEASRQQQAQVDATMQEYAATEESRKAAEAQRETAEGVRAASEADRTAAEQQRVSAEKSRVEAEQQRDVHFSQMQSDSRMAAQAANEATLASREATQMAEEKTALAVTATEQAEAATTAANEAASLATQHDAAAQAAEGKRALAEESREAAEQQRADKETERLAEESKRVEAEAKRGTAETSRASAEAARSETEALRAEEEAKRVSSESARSSAEVTREQHEASRESSESLRAEDEQLRSVEENSRKVEETKRAEAEVERASAENSRVAEEAKRASAEGARAAAETNREKDYTASKQTITDTIATANQTIEATNTAKTNAETATANANAAAKKANDAANNADKVANSVDSRLKWAEIGNPPSWFKDALVCYYDPYRQNLKNGVDIVDGKTFLLKDFSPNGLDMEMHNFQGGGMSGMDGYADDAFIISSNFDATKEGHQFHITRTRTESNLAIFYNKKISLPSFCVKVSGLQEGHAITYISFDGEKMEYTNIEKDGVYKIPESKMNVNSNYLGFSIYTKIANISLDLRIDFLPLYPHALVFDGVDDYGISVNQPQLTDYTLIMERVRISGSGAPMCTKDDGNNIGAFDFEYSNVTYSFGGAKNITPLSDNISWQSKRMYNGDPINSGYAKDSNVLIFSVKNRKQLDRIISIALYKFLLFNRTLTPEEINWVKNIFMQDNRLEETKLINQILYGNK